MDNNTSQPSGSMPNDGSWRALPSHLRNTPPRRPSYTPSYMTNVPKPPRSSDSNSVVTGSNGHSHMSSIRSVDTDMTTASAPKPPPALLVLLVASSPPPSVTSHLESILQRRTFTDIAIIGNERLSSQLTELKMSIFTLVGSMRKEVGVHIHLEESWTPAAVATAMSNYSEKDSLSGVLCYLGSDSTLPGGDSSLAPSKILDTDQDQLENAWRSSVGFLHAAAKAAIPLLQSQSVSQSTSSDAAIPSTIANTPFFIMIQPYPARKTASYRITHTACEQMLSALKTEIQRDELLVGEARELLVLPSKRVGNGAGPPGITIPRLSRPGDGGNDSTDPNPPESPTRLWNMWAMVNEGRG